MSTDSPRHGTWPGNARPRLVAASPAVCSPPADGGRRRLLAIARALARHLDVEIVSLAPTASPERRIEIGPGLVERQIPRSTRHAARERELSATLGGWPVGDLSMAFDCEATPAFLDALAQAASGARLALASHAYAAPPVRAATSLPLWLDAPDHELVLKRSILPRAEAADEALARLAAIEGAAWKSAALVTVASAADGAGLSRDYGSREPSPALLPNGVDVEALPFVGPEERARRQSAAHRDGRFTLFFLGSWHGPNLEAVAALDALAPGLAGCEVRLAGTSAAASRSTAASVVRLGELDEDAKRAELATADLGLNPMRSGTGTNLKLLEYAASGLPVLTTPHGLRGLAFDPEREVAVAEVEDFPAAIERLAADPARRAEMARRARARVEREYDWGRQVDAFARRELTPLLEALA